MPEFTTTTGTIYYDVLEPEQPRGDVLLLHNFMSSGRTAWGNIADDLARDYRVILPDLPGHGRSVGYPADFDHLPMAQQVAALVESLDLFHVHLGGCSAGGTLAQWMVAEELLDVQSMTLISTSYSTSPTTTGVAIDTRPEAYKAGGNWLEVTSKLHDVYQGEGYFERELLPGYRALTPERSVDFSRETLATWELPVCIIHGDEDEIFPVAVAEQMHASLPNSELHIMPRQTHSLIFRRNRQVGEIMRAFLEGQT